MKKGQSAMEYLMTYGWAILIVIVVVAALYGMGVFSLKGGVACSPCFSYFAFVDYADGTLMVRNGAQIIDSINVTGGTPDVTAADPGDDITITSVSTTGDVDITITYDVTDSGLEHTDTATIHN